VGVFKRNMVDPRRAALHRTRMRQAKKAATLGFRVEAINHLRAVLSDISTLSGECGLSCGRRSSSIGGMGGRPTIVWSCGTERLLLYGAICPKMRAHSCRI